MGPVERLAQEAKNGHDYAPDIPCRMCEAITAVGTGKQYDAAIEVVEAAREARHDPACSALIGNAVEAAILCRVPLRAVPRPQACDCYRKRITEALAAFDEANKEKRGER